MGKNKRRTFTVEDSFHNCYIEADSEEEVDFLCWLCEACSFGIVKDFTYQPNQYVLSEAVTYVTVDGKLRNMFREHVYSPDFLIVFDSNKFIDLARELKVCKDALSDNTIVVIDVKGTFAKSDGGRSFSINLKWTYDKCGVYVAKVVPKEFFLKFGVPEGCKLTKKTKKPRKAYLGMKSIKLAFLLDS